MKKKKMSSAAAFAPHILRVIAGLILFVPGAMKLQSLITTGDHMVSGMLGGIVAFAWILALVEFVAGAFVIVNYKAKWAALPLIVIMVAAGFMTYNWSLAGLGGLLFHLVTAAALFSVYANSK